MDGDALVLLTEDMIKQLIPSLGLQTKFLARWKELGLATTSNSPVSEGTTIGSIALYEACSGTCVCILLV